MRGSSAWPTSTRRSSDRCAGSTCGIAAPIGRAAVEGHEAEARARARARPRSARSSSSTSRRRTSTRRRHAGVRDLLLDLRSRGRAVVVSTHNLDEIERVADRVALISRRLVALGEPVGAAASDFRPPADGATWRTGGPAVSDLMAVAERAGGQDVRRDGAASRWCWTIRTRGAPAIVRALVEAGASIRAVFDDQPPLEDVYLRLLSGFGTVSCSRRGRHESRPASAR